jgi:hypothetical protein
VSPGPATRGVERRPTRFVTLDDRLAVTVPSSSPGSHAPGWLDADPPRGSPIARHRGPQPKRQPTRPGAPQGRHGLSARRCPDRRPVPPSEGRPNPERIAARRDRLKPPGGSPRSPWTAHPQPQRRVARATGLSSPLWLSPMGSPTRATHSPIGSSPPGPDPDGPSSL